MREPCDAPCGHPPHEYCGCDAFNGTCGKEAVKFYHQPPFASLKDPFYARCGRHYDDLDVMVLRKGVIEMSFEEWVVRKVLES